MKYTKEERLDIGKRIYDDEFTIYTASEQFGVSVSCAREYMRLYRDTNNLPPKTSVKCSRETPADKSQDLQGLEAMTKEELILEVVKARIAEARLKKATK